MDATLSAIQSAPLKALVVDDEPLLAEAVREELISLGVHSESCGSVAEAKDRIAQSNFDLIVSDVRMPNETGFDLLQWLKKLNPVQPRVVLMTGFSDLTLEAALHAGADALFMKPFDFDAISELIQELTTGKKYSHSKPQGTLDISLSGPLQTASRFMPGRGGCFVAMGPSSHRTGDTVALNIVSSDLHLRCACLVRWCRRTAQNEDHPAGLGLEFLTEPEITNSKNQTVPFPWKHVVPYIPFRREKE